VAVLLVQLSFDCWFFLFQNFGDDVTCWIIVFIRVQQRGLQCHLAPLWI
jgi:hypothetical protein